MYIDMRRRVPQGMLNDVAVYNVVQGALRKQQNNQKSTDHA
jgi:hypothetical protein